jgi:hypothetical protein
MDSIHAAILTKIITDNGFTSGTIAEKFIQCRTPGHDDYLLRFSWDNNSELVGIELLDCWSNSIISSWKTSSAMIHLVLRQVQFFVKEYETIWHS